MRLPQVRAALDNILRVASGEVMIADLQGVKVELPVLAEHVRQRLGLRVALARRLRGVARALAAERGVPGGGAAEAARSSRRAVRAVRALLAQRGAHAGGRLGEGHDAGGRRGVLGGRDELVGVLEVVIALVVAVRIDLRQTEICVSPMCHASKPIYSRPKLASLWAGGTMAGTHMRLLHGTTGHFWISCPRRCPAAPPCHLQAPPC